MECLSTRFTAALFNMSYFGKFYITGKDAQKAVDWIFTNDISGDGGKTIYTCMLNKNAGIEADLTVSLLDDDTPDVQAVLNPAPKVMVRDNRRCLVAVSKQEISSCQSRGFYIAAAGGAAYHNLAHIQQSLQDAGFNDVQLKDCSRQMGMLSIQGPRSRQILQSLTDTDLRNQAFPFSTHKIINVAGHQVKEHG